jgi:hypothetical protein
LRDRLVLLTINRRLREGEMKSAFVITVTALWACSAAAQEAAAPGPDWAAIKAQAEAELAIHNTAKAAAEARSAQIAAETDAARARIGTVTPQTAVTGATAVANGAAQGEALLLVTRSVQRAAERMAGTLASAIEPNDTVLVITDLTHLTVSDVLQFDMQVRQVEAILTAAESSYAAASESDDDAKGEDDEEEVADPDEDQSDTEDEEPGRAAEIGIGAIGVALEAASGIASYFRSDYSFHPISIEIPDQVGASAVVAALQEKDVLATFILPSNLLVSSATTLVDRLTPLQTRYAAVAAQGRAAKARVADLTDAGGDAALISRYEAADAAAGQAATMYNALLTALAASTPDKTESWASRILHQQRIQALLDPPEGAARGSLKVLLLERSEAAALYTQRNLWTIFGGPPLHTMGGTSLAYTLFTPETGQIFASGIVAEHGGYQSVSDVERLFPQ